MNIALFNTLGMLMATERFLNKSINGTEEKSSYDSGQTFIPANGEQLDSHSSSCSELCLTPGCVKAAADVLSNLDETVDPCDDFYRFSCGGWMNRHRIPDDKPSVSVFSVVQDDLDLKLRDLLEKEMDGPQPPFGKMIKDMYNTCMDLKVIDERGAEPLKKVLRELGGWPVMEGSQWDDKNFDWVDSLISFRKVGYSHNILLSLYVAPDFRNNTVHIIELDQAKLGMPDRTYLLNGLNDSSTAAYFRKMVKAAKLLGADEKTVEDELLKSLDFETALANYSLPLEERRNMSKLYNKYTVEELQKLVPQVPWLKYFNGLLNDEIGESETLIVGVPDFIVKFAELITSTEKRVVANYMMWRVVDQSLTLLSKEWRNIAQEYKYAMMGVSQEEPRWKTCLSSNIVIGLGSYYVRHYFKEESKDAALNLVNYIHREFLNILDGIDWMDDQTKKEAKAKANAIQTNIGYPEEMLNNTAVMELYENLTITNVSYFENMMSKSRWYIDSEFSDLRKPHIKGAWKNHAFPAEVDAFYSPLENSIEFPAGILQNGFFNKDRPQYMNFGAIGFVIGHEITHGFDDTGRQFDKDGNNVNWWGESTDVRFKEKAQCIIDQYSNYTAENGMNLNGINTQGENIADNGGLKEAYWAYQSWVKANGPEKMLPGLKYTQNQLFWISAAYVECAKWRPEVLKDTIISDSHSPSQFRVIGPLSNLQEFAADFNCPADSPMNKKHKCQVW